MKGQGMLELLLVFPVVLIALFGMEWIGRQLLLRQKAYAAIRYETWARGRKYAPVSYRDRAFAGVPRRDVRLSSSGRRPRLPALILPLLGSRPVMPDRMEIRLKARAQTTWHAAMPLDETSHLPSDHLVNLEDFARRSP